MYVHTYIHIYQDIAKLLILHTVIDSGQGATAGGEALCKCSLLLSEPTYVKLLKYVHTCF